MGRKQIEKIVLTTALIIPYVCKKRYTLKVLDRAGPSDNWSPKPRFEVLKRMERKKYDIFVIGGGSAGAGIALDASSRGMSVALIEKDDFASGTSSKSSKLLHGGVRYFEKAWNSFSPDQLKFVWNALAERSDVMRMIPHLSKSVEFMVPVYRTIMQPYYFFGMKMYDWLSMSRSLGDTKFLNRDKTLSKFKNLKQKNLIGSVVYKDGFFLDFRANIMLMMTAAYHGADVVNYVELIKFEYENGQISGAIVRDKMTNKTLTVRSKAFVSTAGPFTDNIRSLAKEKYKLLQTSSGSHIVLKKNLDLKIWDL